MCYRLYVRSSSKCEQVFLQGTGQTVHFSSCSQRINGWFYSHSTYWWLIMTYSSRTNISCILKSSTTLKAIFPDENCVNSRQCSFMTQWRYWTPIDPLATLKGIRRGPSKANHAGDVTGPLQLYYLIRSSIKPSDKLLHSRYWLLFCLPYIYNIIFKCIYVILSTFEAFQR